MVAYGEKRAGELKERGFENAGLYNPAGVQADWARRTMLPEDRNACAL